jgi:hypothetical protein
MKFFDRFLAPLSEGLNSAVAQITHKPADLVPGCGALSKVPKSNALDLATDEKPSGDHRKAEVSFLQVWPSERKPVISDIDLQNAALM